MSEHKQNLPRCAFPMHRWRCAGWNEMVHRYFAGALGLVILALPYRRYAVAANTGSR